MYHHDPSVQFQKYEPRCFTFTNSRGLERPFRIIHCYQKLSRISSSSLIVPISLYLHSVEINFHKEIFFLVFVFFLGIKI